MIGIDQGERKEVANRVYWVAVGDVRGEGKQQVCGSWPRPEGLALGW